MMGRVYQRMTKTNEAGSEKKNMGQRENGPEVNGSSVDLPDVMEPPANIYDHGKGDILGMEDGQPCTHRSPIGKH